MSNASYVLRTLYIDPSLDERLKREAYVANVSKNELIRKYLEIGISSVDHGNHPPVSKKVIGFNATDASPSDASVAAAIRLLHGVHKHKGTPTKAGPKKATHTPAKKATKNVAKKSVRKAIKSAVKKAVKKTTPKRSHAA